MITPAFVTHVFGGPPPAPGGGWDTFGIVGTASAATPDVEDHKFNAAGAPLWPTSRTNANGDSADVGYVASPLNDGTGTGDIRFGGFVNSNIGVTAAFRIRPHPDDLGQDFFAVAALTLVHSGFDIGVQLNVDGGAPIVDFTSAAQGSSSAYHLDDRVFFSVCGNAAKNTCAV